MLAFSILPDWHLLAMLQNSLAVITLAFFKTNLITYNCVEICYILYKQFKQNGSCWFQIPMWFCTYCRADEAGVLFVSQFIIVISGLQGFTLGTNQTRGRITAEGSEPSTLHCHSRGPTLFGFNACTRHWLSVCTQSALRAEWDEMRLSWDVEAAFMFLLCVHSLLVVLALFPFKRHNGEAFSFRPIDQNCPFS